MKSREGERKQELERTALASERLVIDSVSALTHRRPIDTILLCRFLRKSFIFIGFICGRRCAFSKARSGATSSIASTCFPLYFPH
ncbi:MAG: hypothetical protein JWN45_1749 [Acidobacteriaceae bacterium]|nr:hypothetical protein [Acidobacteriaceae bacterium]